MKDGWYGQVINHFHQHPEFDVDVEPGQGMPVPQQPRRQLPQAGHRRELPRAAPLQQIMPAPGPTPESQVRNKLHLTLKGPQNMILPKQHKMTNMTPK